MSSIRPHVVRVLRETGALLRLSGEEGFKARAYENAADTLPGEAELLRRVSEGTLRELPGIGPALEQKITELVNTGHLAYHADLKAKFPPGILELVEVPELGPRKALVLWEALGIGDVEALEAACRAGAVRGVTGFGARTELKILAGIERFKARRADPRVSAHLVALVRPVAESIRSDAAALEGVSRAEIAGSVRRFCETVRDVNLLLATSAPGPALANLALHPEVAEPLGAPEADVGAVTTRARFRLRRDELALEVRCVLDEAFAAALVRFTGSAAHVVRLEGLARERGLELDALRVPDEAAVYAALGLPFIPPELREDEGEIEAALAGARFDDLIEEADVLGNVHSHSTWSDGNLSLAQMAEAARARGFRYLTVTDHSQSAHYARGLKLGELMRQWDEIDALNEALGGFRLLKGIESDLLSDGALDFPEPVLARLDVVIGSIHNRHQQGEAEMTRRVLTAFDHPHLHIWGHPTGRLIGKRDPVPLRMEEVLDKAAARGIVMEVNGSPDRLDLSAEHVRMALARGLKLVVSTDAHSLRDLENVRFAVSTARRGGARKADVLNTLDADAFLAALRRSA